MSRIAVIMDVVGAQFQVNRADLLSPRRMRVLARPRQVVMWIARHETPYSLPVIGRCVGDRDHTTVLHAIAKVDELRTADFQFRELTDNLRREVKRRMESPVVPQWRMRFIDEWLDGQRRALMRLAATNPQKFDRKYGEPLEPALSEARAEVSTSG